MAATDIYPIGSRAMQLVPRCRVLNERFARGEIKKEEYAEKKAALLSGS